MSPPVLRKYPRTPHIQGSRLQSGDEDLEQTAFELLRGRHIVVEEKVDGANSAVSFTPEGQLLLQSRGHFLDGGARERHFALFKTWASVHKAELWERLGARYVMYGEWMYAKHTIFYDHLPHYFLEFDIFDTLTNIFLSTAGRGEMLAGMPVASVPVLYSGRARSMKHLLSLVGASQFKSLEWREHVRAACERRNQNAARVFAQTDGSSEMEGLYIKVEEDGHVVERYKYVRTSFLSSVDSSGSHWLERPILPNALRGDVDIFAKS
ncbi:MAG: RNA ligase family protein [Pyrinomonadaceae bacterium MAG19_C2-C3]|nr:RNA ligase family protein [Pyrinomonadaceae bacterium MAG19_C2-C3]